MLRGCVLMTTIGTGDDDRDDAFDADMIQQQLSELYCQEMSRYHRCYN